MLLENLYRVLFDSQRVVLQDIREQKYYGMVQLEIFL